MISNKKIIITVLSFAILTVGIVAGTILVQKNQDIREKAAPLTNLSFNPASVSVIKGQNFTASAKVVTGTNLVTGVDIELVYNPAVIQLTSITPTPALNSFTNLTTGGVVKNEIDNIAGKARFVAYTFDTTLGISGTKNILNIAGTVLSNSATGIYQINYGALTAIAALNEGQNALLGKTGLTVNVTSPTATSTASPTVSSTASPIPTATVTATPTSSPSPTSTSTTYADWDVYPDGIINMVDIGIVVDNYDMTNPTNPRADVDKKDGVNVVDLGIIIDHYE